MTGKGAAAGVGDRGGPGIRLSLRKKGESCLHRCYPSLPREGHVGGWGGRGGSGMSGESTFGAGNEAVLGNK